MELLFCKVNYSWQKAEVLLFLLYLRLCWTLGSRGCIRAKRRREYWNIVPALQWRKFHSKVNQENRSLLLKMILQDWESCFGGLWDCAWCTEWDILGISSSCLEFVHKIFPLWLQPHKPSPPLWKTGFQWVWAADFKCILLGRGEWIVWAWVDRWKNKSSKNISILWRFSPDKDMQSNLCSLLPLKGCEGVLLLGGSFPISSTTVPFYTPSPSWLWKKGVDTMDLPLSSFSPSFLSK